MSALGTRLRKEFDAAKSSVGTSCPPVAAAMVTSLPRLFLPLQVITARKNPFPELAPYGARAPPQELRNGPPPFQPDIDDRLARHAGTVKTQAMPWPEDMESPFEDPAVRSAFRRAGVVDKPGMADELMRELAPLLAAEGIDLNDPSTVDIATLDEAMGRAVERRNFELFVAVGETREYALTVLRMTSEALAEGSVHLVEVVIRGLEPEPEEAGKPSIAQMIGVSLGMLDTRHSDASLAGVVAGSRVPKWNSRARSAATDILSLARKGHAFDSIGTLHRNHSGLVILEGGVIAVAGTVQAWAAAENQSVRDRASAVLAE